MAAHVVQQQIGWHGMCPFHPSCDQVYQCCHMWSEWISRARLLGIMQPWWKCPHISNADRRKMVQSPKFLQQKLQKSCSRCNKNTWHVESGYILQPPKYLLLFVNRFRYIINNATKDRCSIPMDTTVRLGPLKFSLRATIDHHGLSIHSGHYTASINCCKKHSIATITQLRSLELLIAKTPLLHMLYYMNWLTHGFGLEQEGGSLIAPMVLAHPLHPIDNRSRNKRRNLWDGWCVSSWWP